MTTGSLCPAMNTSSNCLASDATKIRSDKPASNTAASATASGIGCIGHGTDIAGSIRYPAYACGIHGIRPSLGRVPMINYSAPDRYIGGQIMAVSGPLARSIKDLELGYDAMRQSNYDDTWWTPLSVSYTHLTLPTKA